MILADRRFGRAEKFSKLPKWLRDNLGTGSTNLSVEESLAIAKKFLRQMAQPFPREAQFGIRYIKWNHHKLLFISLVLIEGRNLKFFEDQYKSNITDWLNLRFSNVFLWNWTKWQQILQAFSTRNRRPPIWSDWSARLRCWSSNKHSSSLSCKLPVFNTWIALEFSTKPKTPLQIAQKWYAQYNIGNGLISCRHEVAVHSQKR